MIFWISLDIHRVIVVNLRFGEIRYTILSLFIDSMTTGTVYLVKYFPLFKPVDRIFPGFLSVVRRYVVLYFFLGGALNKNKKTYKHKYETQVLH